MKHLGIIMVLMCGMILNNIFCSCKDNNKESNKDSNNVIPISNGDALIVNSFPILIDSSLGLDDKEHLYTLTSEEKRGYANNVILDIFNTYVDSVEYYKAMLQHAIARDNKATAKFAITKMDSIYEDAIDQINGAMIYIGFDLVETTEVADYLEKEIGRENKYYVKEE